MVRVPRVGLGYRRQRAGTGLFEEVRVRNRVERSHPPDNAKGRRERDISYCRVNGIPATAAWQGRFTGADESAGGAVENLAGNYRCELRAGPARSGSRRFFARVRVN